MTDVRFLLGVRALPDDDDLTFLPADEALAARERFAGALADVVRGYAGGAIEVVVGDATAHVEDTLRYLVLGLCFGAVPPLVRGEEFVYDYAEGFAAVTLRPRGENVDVSGREVTPLTCPRLDLARALLACGDDYVGLLRSLGAHPDDVQVLTDAGDAARAALAAD